MTRKRVLKKPKPYTKFYLDKLGQLEGGTIEGVTFDPTDHGFDVEFFGIIVRMKNNVRKAVFFLRDDEGNGPGSFEIQDV